MAAAVGIRNALPAFSMVPVRRLALMAAIMEEGEVILDGVEKVVKFGSQTRSLSLSLYLDHHWSMATKFILRVLV